MRGCDQELCAHRTGDGCFCGLLDIEPDDDSDHPRTLLDMFLISSPPTLAERILDAISDVLAATPPFSWIDRLLGGPVGRPK